MAIFKDRNGTTWEVDVNVSSLKKLRSFGVDLLEDKDKKGDVLLRLMQDPIFLVDTIYILCEKQATERDISDEDFGALVGKGDTIDLATDALIEELTLFYRGRGETIKLAVEKVKMAEKAMSAEAKKALESVSVEDLAKEFGKALVKSLESSGSIQAPSPSEN